MKHLTNLREGKKIFEALNSDVRVSILEMLMEHKELNLDNFAKELKISNSAVTMHIKKLLDADLIKITPASGIRGSMKLCSLNIDKLLINFDLERLETSVYSFELDIGHYVNYEVMPTCGLVSSTGIIGEFDEPRYFSFPERFQAALLWFQSGFLEYKIPNALKPDETVKELQVSMEIASEARVFHQIILRTSIFRSTMSISVIGPHRGNSMTAGATSLLPGGSPISVSTENSKCFP